MNTCGGGSLRIPVSPPGRFAPPVGAAAELKVEHGALHEQVDRVFLGQADAAVELDRLFGDDAIDVARQRLERAEIGRRGLVVDGARPEQGLGPGDQHLEVGAAVLERLEHG